jgi:hypothetical protein
VAKFHFPVLQFPRTQRSVQQLAKTFQVSTNYNMTLCKVAIHWRVISKMPSLLWSFNGSFIVFFVFIRLIFPQRRLLQFALFYVRRKVGQDADLLWY